MTPLASNALALITAGYKSRRLLVKIKRSKLTVQILNLFYNAGLIRGFGLSNNSPTELIVFLKYADSKPMLKSFKIFSSGGRRVYCRAPYVLTRLVNNGYFVISTSRLGIVSTLTLLEARDRIKCGGELLFRIMF